MPLPLPPPKTHTPHSSSTLSLPLLSPLSPPRPLVCVSPPPRSCVRYGPCEAGELKDRMLRAVASLGQAEVRSILEEQGQVEVTCELCNEQFQFGEADVMQYV